MAHQSWQIGSYTLSFFSTPYLYRGSISLYKPDGSYIGAALFWNRRVGGDAAYQRSDGTMVVNFYDMDEFNRLLDLLRNETPLFLNYSGGLVAWFTRG